MGIYRIMEGIQNRVLMAYIMVGIYFVFVFSYYDIKLNTFMGMIVASVFIYYMYDKKTTLNNEIEDERKVKLNTISPEPQMITDKHDMIDFLYSIQDLYVHNPLAYEEMIDNIDGFFKIYKYIKDDSKYKAQLYDIAETKKQNAINNLQSMIFNLPTSDVITDKYNRAHKRLETLLTNYLNIIHDETQNDLAKNGYDVETKILYTGPKESNHYFDKDFTFQIY